MIKRLNIYLKEMYPVIPRLVLGFILFFEIYFLVILTSNVRDISIGVQEIVGAVTIFTFLLSLRIADEFKDYEVDLKLFPERPYPSGRVKRNDLIVLLTTIIIITVALNLIFMNNIVYFAILTVYGVAMSLWFFSKHKIQKSLPLALVTHNPVQLILNLYVISFTCLKYGIGIFSINNAIILLTLYFPGLIWEISRKTRAPEEETEYTTYSKIFGYKKATKFIMLVMVFDMITSSMLVYQLYPLAVITVIVSYLWFLKQGRDFIKNPSKFKLVQKVIVYEYITELTVVAIEVIYIFNRWII
ncbi:MAG: UbiA family prenyltransferase [Clostridia bacterium]|nr:UbiA family prenyltransferase [Clostridia bacterium]